MAPQSFIILAPLNGAAGNEYRINNGSVEFRLLKWARGCPRPGPWRTLHPNQVRFHLSLQTPVGKWLRRHLEQQSLAAATSA